MKPSLMWTHAGWTTLCLLLLHGSACHLPAHNPKGRARGAAAIGVIWVGSTAIKLLQLLEPLLSHLLQLLLRRVVLSLRLPWLLLTQLAQLLHGSACHLPAHNRKGRARGAAAIGVIWVGSTAIKLLQLLEPLLSHLLQLLPQ